jgi:hypothetical protein
MSYDEKCYALAETFLDDADTQHINNKNNRSSLAQAIQDAIEDFIGLAKNDYEASRHD